MIDVLQTNHDAVVIALITTVPTIGTVIIGFLTARNGWRKDRDLQDLKMEELRRQGQAIHTQVNGNNEALLHALQEANERLARTGQPVVRVVAPVKDPNA